MILSFLPSAGLPSARLLRQGVLWWLSELAGMLPGPVLRLATGHGMPAVIFDFGPDWAVLTMPGQPGSGEMPLSRILDGETDRRIGAALHRHRRSNAVTVRLDPALVFETVLELPAAGASAMKALLQHQLERLVPMPAASLCFEYKLGARIRNGTMLRVHLAVVKRTVLERAIVSAEAAGLSPKIIIAAAAERPAGRAVSPYVFWRASEKDGQTVATKRLRHTLEVLIALMAIFAYGSHLYRLDDTCRRLRIQVEQAKQEATNVQELSRRVNREKDSASFFQERRRGPTALYVLDELTALVPQDSWANHLALHGRTVEIMGFSPHAAELIARIETSPAFANPHFRSPITLAPDGKMERFHVAFDVRDGSSQ